MRAGALEKLREDFEAEAKECGLDELKVQSDAAAPDAERAKGKVQVQDEAEADDDVVNLSSVHAQVHSELHDAEMTEKTFLLDQTSQHTENEKDVDTSGDVETEPFAEAVEDENEESAEGNGIANETLETEANVKF